MSIEELLKNTPVKYYKFGLNFLDDLKMSHQKLITIESMPNQGATRTMIQAATGFLLNNEGAGVVYHSYDYGFGKMTDLFINALSNMRGMSEEDAYKTMGTWFRNKKLLIVGNDTVKNLDDLDTLLIKNSSLNNCYALFLDNSSALLKRDYVDDLRRVGLIHKLIVIDKPHFNNTNSKDSEFKSNAYFKLTKDNENNLKFICKKDKNTRIKESLLHKEFVYKLTDKLILELQ